MVFLKNCRCIVLNWVETAVRSESSIAVIVGLIDLVFKWTEWALWMAVHTLSRIVVQLIVSWLDYLIITELSSSWKLSTEMSVKERKLPYQRWNPSSITSSLVQIWPLLTMYTDRTTYSIGLMALFFSYVLQIYAIVMNTKNLFRSYKKVHAQERLQRKLFNQRKIDVLMKCTYLSKQR